MASNFLEQMGERIAGRRRELKITQEGLADMINVSVQTISNIETGKKAVRPENLAKICTALNVSADFILLGIKTAEQVSDISKKFASLPSEKYDVIESLIDTMLK